MAKEEAKVSDIKGFRLLGTRLQGEEFSRQAWVANVSAGTPYKDVLRPDFWTHVAAKLKKWSKVTVIPEDGAYYAELLVVMTSKTDVVVKQLLFMQLEATQEVVVDSKDYRIDFGGPAVKWRVTRKNDRKVVKDGFENTELAKAWLRDYEKAVA